jgi:hypothetical protein
MRCLPSHQIDSDPAERSFSAPPTAWRKEALPSSFERQG